LQRDSYKMMRGCCLVLLAILAVGCDSAATALPVTENTRTPSVKIADAGALSGTFYGYTNQNASGNRWVSGQGALPAALPLDIELEGVPKWVVAAPWESGSLWVAILEDGQVQAFSVVGGAVREEIIDPNRLPPGMPPLLRVRDGVPTLLIGAAEDATPWSSPLPLNQNGPKSRPLAYIARNGDLVLGEVADSPRIPLNALPDSRLLVDSSGRLVLLTGPTDRYGHGVLGDRLEASSLKVVDLRAHPRSVLEIEIPEGDVAEGIAPILADLTGDGRDEIVLTLSNSRVGARLAVLDSTGQIVAEGPPIGRGGRWRHQLAVAPFGPNGEIELVDVLTPHLGVVVEFFRLEGDELKLVARLPGFSTHLLGSRNLDMALAGDLDGDGRIELLVPTQDKSRLGGIRRTATGAEIAWELPLPGRISTNIGAVSLAGGALGVGVGGSDGVLRLWLPP
jgi:hypothetical protein